MVGTRHCRVLFFVNNRWINQSTINHLPQEETPLAVEVESSGEQITSGQGSTDGTDEVDLVVAGA